MPEIRWVDDPQQLLGPFGTAQLAAVENVSAGYALSLIACTASDNVVEAALLAHVLDFWDKQYGVHLIALGDEETPEIVIRFPNPGDNEEAIIASVSAVADELMAYREPNGALQFQLWWD